MKNITLLLWLWLNCYFGTAVHIYYPMHISHQPSRSVEKLRHDQSTHINSCYVSTSSSSTMSHNVSQSLTHSLARSHSIHFCLSYKCVITLLVWRSWLPTVIDVVWFWCLNVARKYLLSQLHWTSLKQLQSQFQSLSLELVVHSKSYFSLHHFWCRAFFYIFSYSLFRTLCTMLSLVYIHNAILLYDADYSLGVCNSGYRNFHRKLCSTNL